jgi:mannose-6-phosphate isomerase
LPVHCHPDRTFSRRHLGLSYGKTEAWIVIATHGVEPRLYVGFREPVEAETLLDWVVSQQTDRLLSAVNVLPARRGQAILVPAGIPHAIGEGVFVLELQEPTDLSVLMEWRDLLPIDGMKEGHLGLGFEVALQAVDRSAWSPDRLRTLSSDRLGGRLAFPKEADPFFRAERIRTENPVELSPSFAILVVLEGQGLLWAENWNMPVARGDTLLLPFAAGTCRLEGQISAVRCLPPGA